MTVILTIASLQSCHNISGTNMYFQEYLKNIKDPIVHF